jgi:hypothetical protein
MYTYKATSLSCYGAVLKCVVTKKYLRVASVFRRVRKIAESDC